MQDSNFTKLYNLKQKLAEDNLDINCQILINFFKNRDLSSIDDLIKLTDPDLVSAMRSHAMALRINKTEYLSLLRQNPAKYQKFLCDLTTICDSIVILNAGKSDHNIKLN